MKTKTRLIYLFIALSFCFSMAAWTPLVQESQPPAISSDQSDYPPGATVTLTGTNWAAGETVHLYVNDDMGNSWSLESNPDPEADDAGMFTFVFELPSWFIANYRVTATGSSGSVAYTTFTDLSIGTWDQCKNGAAGNGPNCDWTTGNLSSGSLYSEGDATPQRLWLTGFVPGSTHTVTFVYGTTKSGKHAYDFLTTYNFSETWITASDRCSGITGCTDASDMTFAIPLDPNVPDAYENFTRLFTMRGGTITGATTPVIESGDYTGTSETSITVSFTVGPDTGSMCSTKNDVTTCDIALWFGAHVAAQTDWGAGTGAGNISGSPYHVKLDKVDGESAGGRDNQMASATIIANGTIVIAKDAVPNHAQDFSFSLTNNTTITENFSLDDDADGTLPSSQTFSVPPGAYTASELSVPSGWELTNLVCVDPTTNTTVNLGTRTATINLASAETVTCTFTNTQGGHIIVKKLTDPASGTQSFEFDPSWSTSNFFLTDQQTHDSGSLVPGTYSVAENTPPSTYEFTGATCDDGSLITAIDLSAGETVTCTFNNKRVYNKDLTVTKTAAAAFNRTYNWLIDKSVDDTQIEIAAGGKATFNYSVLVTPDGYTDSEWSVIGQITVSNPNTFDVTGVTVTDAIDNGGVCSVTGGTDVTVAAGGNVVLDYSCTYASAPGTAAGTNTATAAWNAETFNTVNTSASGTAGIDFSAVTPTETNKTITVIDDKTDPLNPVTLGTWNWGDGAHTFTYALDKLGVSGTCTDYTNTAVIDETQQSDPQTVTVCVGLDLAVEKTAAATLDRTYKWLINKSVDDTRIEIAEGGTATFNYSVKVTPDGYTDTGWTLGGTITITNPNDWEDVTVGVADVLDQGGTCTITETAPYVVPKAGSLVLNYTCTTDGSTTENTADVTWDNAVYFTPSGTASDDAPVSFTLDQEINKVITVIDDKTDPLNPVTLGTWNWLDGEHSFTYSLPQNGIAGTCTDFPNTAVIDETGQSDPQTVTVCVGRDLTLVKTAAGTFNRTYLWEIFKNVDQTSISIADGGLATFNYTIQVNQTGFTDSGWTLSGKITLTNPNDWEDITLTGLTDVVDNGGVCTVDPGPYKVLKSGTLDVNYTCAYGAAPSSYSGKNTAAATWDMAVSFTPNNTASGDALFTLTQLGSTNQTVHVTDTYGGALGTLVATDGTPYTTATYNYAHDFEGVGGTCTDYDNTATITETKQTAGKSVEVCVGLDLTVAKTASGTFDRTYLWGILKDVDQTSIKIAAGGTATFNYTVDVNQTGFTDSGWYLEGLITITNPNDWEDITLTSLSDVVDNGGTCTLAPVTLMVPADDTLEVAYSCTYASAPGSYSGKNTATAVWDEETYFTPTGEAFGDHGFTLTQKGSTDKTVHVTDTLGGALGEVTAVDAEPYATATFNYAHGFAGLGGTCTEYDNTATITETEQDASKSVEVCVGVDLVVTKTAAGTFNRTYLWEILKDVNKTEIDIALGDTATFSYTVQVNQTGFTDSGWTLSGKITITNPNDWEDIALVTLSDVVDNGGVCTVDPGPYLVPKSGSMDVNYTCAYASAPGSYSGKNTATATWDAAAAFTPTGTDSGDSSFTLTQLGSTNKEVHVTDTLGGALGSVTAVDAMPYATATFSYDYDFEGVGGTCTDYDNTASITETKQTAEKEVTVCVGVNLTVSKTAVPTFKRTFNWTIDKDVDKTFASQAEPVTFYYTVVVTQTGFTDSDWKIEGKITVNNPNDWQAITADITDAVDIGGGAVCTVTGGTAVSIPASSSVERSYSCSFSSKPAYTGLNTASATWDKAVFHTPSGTAVGTAAVTFTNPVETNKMIHITDTFNGATVALGAVTGVVTPPYTIVTFNYSHTVPVPLIACVSYDNTATIVETKQSDSLTIKVCVPSILTDTSYCPLPNNQFRLLYHLATTPNIYRLQASNPGQFYFNAFYYGEPGSAFTMDIEIPYPFVTQEGAGKPIQVHDGTGLTENGCFMPYPSLSGFTITTEAMTPTSSAGNQIITPDDYATKQLGESTTVTVSGVVPESGVVYVTLHLDYGLKKTTGWKPTGTLTNDPVSGSDIADLRNNLLGITIHGYEVYTFSRTVGLDTSLATPSSVNDPKKFAGFVGFVLNAETGNPMAGTEVVIYSPNGAKLATLYTDADGFYIYSYKHTSKSAIYTIKLPGWAKSSLVTVKPNGFAAVDFDVP